jgi:hypothetical protein
MPRADADKSTRKTDVFIFGTTAGQSNPCFVNPMLWNVGARLKSARQWLSDYFAEADCAVAFLAFGTRKTRMQPGHNGLRGAKRHMTPS